MRRIFAIILIGLYLSAMGGMEAMASVSLGESKAPPLSIVTVTKVALTTDAELKSCCKGTSEEALNSSTSPCKSDCSGPLPSFVSLHESPSVEWAQFEKDHVRQIFAEQDRRPPRRA